MKIIYRARDINEAHIVAGLLQSHRIDAHVGGYYLQGGVGELPASGLAQVYIADEDTERATQVIRLYENKQQAASQENPGVPAAVAIAVILLSVLAILFFAVTYGN